MNVLAPATEVAVFLPFRMADITSSRFNILLPPDKTMPRGALVFNTFSGAAAELDASEAEILTRNWLHQPLGKRELLANLDIFDSLYSAGFLVDIDSDEGEQVRQQMRYCKANREHLDLTIAPTLICNFQCTYCGQKKAQVSFSSTDLADLGGFLEKAIDAHTKSIVIHWYGGEPTLCIPEIRAVSRLLLNRIEQSQILFDAEMFTNSWLLDEEMCRTLKEECRISTLMVSVDGPAEIHDKLRGGKPGLGNLMTILDRVETALHYFGVKLRIHCQRGNVDRMGQLLRTLRHHGFPDSNRRWGHPLMVHFSKLYDFTDECSHVREVRIPQDQWGAVQTSLMEEAQALGFHVSWLPRRSIATYCMAQRKNAFLIVPGGHIFKCFNHDLTEPAQAMGHLTNSDIRYCTTGGLDPCLNPDCDTCIYMPVCSGECPHHYWAEIPCTHLKDNLERRLIGLWNQQRGIGK